MKQVKFAKYIVLILLALFFVTQLWQKPNSKANFDDVVGNTIKDVDMSSLELQDNLAIKRFLGLAPEEYSNIVYFKNIDSMQASEILIVKFSSNDQASKFKEVMNQRIENQKNIFDGYIESESNLLKNAIIDVQANYAIYVVSQDANTILSQFRRAL